MNALEKQSLITLAVTLFIVYRFAQRELKERIVRLRTLWIRPAIMAALSIYLVILAATVDSGDDFATGTISLAGIVLGFLTGIAIIRNTHFSAADVPNAVRVMGNKLTLGIWIGAFAIRLIARYVVPHGADPRAQLPLNCGAVIMAATAFVTIAIAFVIEIRRFSALPPSATL